MAIGGFDNEGGNLTLAQFKQYVSRGEIHYYIASTNSGGGGGGQAPTNSGARPGGVPSRTATARRTPGATGAAGGQGGSSSSAITSWVKAHHKTVTVGGQTLYDLTQARA
jgi:hypothetical protein